MSLLFHIPLATIIHDVSKMQKHVHDKNLYRCLLTVKSHVAACTEAGELQFIVWKAIDLASSTVHYILNKYKIKQGGKTTTPVLI
jgi:hypothetical protein